MRHISASCSRFEHGILKHRWLEGETQEESIGWRHGHPIPVPEPRIRHGRTRFPDPRTDGRHAHTYYIYYYSDWPREGENPNQREDEIPVYHVPIAGVDEQGQPIWAQLDNNSGQDHFAWTSQGPRMRRDLEKLGQSDIGIILFRRMLMEQMQLMEDGGEPMNVFRDPAQNDIIWLPFDRMEDEVIEGKTAIPKQKEHRGEASPPAHRASSTR